MLQKRVAGDLVVVVVVWKAQKVIQIAPSQKCFLKVTSNRMVVEGQEPSTIFYYCTKPKCCPT